MSIRSSRPPRKLRASRLDSMRMEILGQWAHGVSMPAIARDLLRRRGVRVSASAVRRRIRRWCAL